MEHLKNMLEEFPIKFKANELAANPVTLDMFDGEDGKYLEKELRESFHRTTAKSLFPCERARPDAQPTVSVLCARVRKPTEKDLNKLVRMMKCRIQRLTTHQAQAPRMALAK